MIMKTAILQREFNTPTQLIRKDFGADCLTHRESEVIYLRYDTQQPVLVSLASSLGETP